jgi:hypothetical protein
MRTPFAPSPPNTFRSVTLYLNDIKDIISAMQRATTETVIISDGAYKYDTLEELVEASEKRIGRLSLDTGCRSISLRIR